MVKLLISFPLSGRCTACAALLAALIAAPGIAQDTGAPSAPQQPAVTTEAGDRTPEARRGKPDFMPEDLRPEQTDPEDTRWTGAIPTTGIHAVLALTEDIGETAGVIRYFDRRTKALICQATLSLVDYEPMFTSGRFHFRQALDSDLSFPCQDGILLSGMPSRMHVPVEIADRLGFDTYAAVLSRR